MSRNQIIEDQAVASIVQQGISQKLSEKAARLVEIQQVAMEKVCYARTALGESLQHVENVRDFVSSPEHILGPMQTKHGEIAEHIEVEIGNAKDILRHIKPRATFDGVGRTAPEDYLVGGLPVQSKFINGANKSLNHVIDHLRHYPNFANDGYYHIPKDQFELINKIANGEAPINVHSRQIAACKEAIKEIENLTGKQFSNVVKSGISTYDEVQLGRIDQTLESYEHEFKEANAQEIKEIRDNASKESAEAQHITDASWGEAFKYAGIAAVIGGGVEAGISIYSKVKKGQKLSEFSVEDWKSVGFDFAKGGVKGGISGLAIYGLTKVGGFSAPFAGAIASTAVGIASLASEYKKGAISQCEFSECACSLSVEAGIASIGAALGQVIIPIPVLGAIIGTATSKAALEITKYVMGNKEKELIITMQNEYEALVNSLNQNAQRIIKKMDDYYSALDGYINAALSPDSAMRFYGSIELCEFLGVNPIHNDDELDEFMLL